jgi:hypothetical protein
MRGEERRGEVRHRGMLGEERRGGVRHRGMHREERRGEVRHYEFRSDLPLTVKKWPDSKVNILRQTMLRTRLRNIPVADVGSDIAMLT